MLNYLDIWIWSKIRWIFWGLIIIQGLLLRKMRMEKSIHFPVMGRLVHLILSLGTIDSPVILAGSIIRKDYIMFSNSWLNATRFLFLLLKTGHRTNMTGPAKPIWFHT